MLSFDNLLQEQKKKKKRNEYRTKGINTNQKFIAKFQQEMLVAWSGQQCGSDEKW